VKDREEPKHVDPGDGDRVLYTVGFQNPFFEEAGIILL
jgi:hypothetical protein